MPRKPDEDQPRAHRFGARLPALAVHEGHEYECTAEDFSRSGLLLTGPREWPIVGEFDLFLKAATGHPPESIRVRIVRRQHAPVREGHRVAVEFVETDPGSRQAIELLLQRVIEAHAIFSAPPDIPPGTPPHEVRKLLERIPLSQRITFASRGAPRQREIALQDPHPQVLEALARNTNLLVHEARALASSQNLLPSTLTLLATDDRWTGDEEIKIAIVSHSRIPVPAAEKMIARMKPAALRRALQRPGMSAPVRSAILRRLTREH